MGLFAAQKVFLDPNRPAELHWTLDPQTFLRKLTITTWYKVLYDRSVSDPLIVISATDGVTHLPKPGDMYRNSNGGFSPECRLLELNPIEEPKTQGKIWNVQCQYASGIADQSMASGDPWGVRVGFDGVEYRESIYQDRDARAIRNINDDQFSAQIDETFYLEQISLSFNTLHLDHGILKGIRGHVNKNAVNVTIAGTPLQYDRNSLLCTRANAVATIGVTPAIIKGDSENTTEEYWQVEIDLLNKDAPTGNINYVAKDIQNEGVFGWSRVILNEGPQYKDNDGNLVRFKDDRGLLVPTPRYLDSDGKKSTKPFFRVFDTKPEFDFALITNLLKGK